MFDDRFARQNRFGPPPEFPLASAYTSIDHHLSGLRPYALASPTFKRQPTSRWCGASAHRMVQLHTSHLSWHKFSLYFHCASGFRTVPLTRVWSKLLGPCFKTGRMNYVHFKPQNIDVNGAVTTTNLPTGPQMQSLASLQMCADNSRV